MPAATPRRINVSSGRPLESRAQYSRALRVGERVLQSGTTAIDRDGNIIGQNVHAQTATILNIARASMGLAEGRFADVVRARLFVKGRENLAPAVAAFAALFTESRPALTVIPISALARPTQLIEIELETLDNAGDAARALTLPGAPGTPAAVLHNQRLMIGGQAPSGATPQQQFDLALDAIDQLVAEAGAASGDLVALRIGTSDLHEAPTLLAAFCARHPSVRPALSLLGVPPLASEQQSVVVEAEAIIGAAAQRRDVPHPQHPGFASAVSIGAEIYLSNLLPLQAHGSAGPVGDWGGQRDCALGGLEQVLASVDASLDDVVVRRYYTRADADMNRAYGDGPAWFARTRPAALGCRIESLTDPQALIAVEAHAVRGAGNNIDWRELAAS